jgi:hypothetical protein
MSGRLLSILLAIGLALSATLAVTRASSVRLAGIHQGYEPAQPIAFSHRLHAGDLQIACQYCHSGAERSRHAGIPAASTCMNCHRFVTTAFGAVRAEDDAARKEGRKPQLIVAPELQKLHDALALDPTSMQPAAGKAPSPIAWTKVHVLPDYVYFDHRGHVAAGVQCQRCHGPVETMERVRQFESLTMGWCVNCHRQVSQTGVNGRPANASIDCVTCHY